MSEHEHRLIRDGLDAHAEHAPPAHGLAAAARARRTRRHRRRAGAGAALAALAVVAAGVLVVQPGSGSDPTDAPVAGTAATAPDDADTALPEGWRWETYAGVQVGVPGDWANTNGTQAISQWCVDRRPGAQPADPGFVGRPGGATLVGCPQEPGPTLAFVGPFVDFAPTPRGESTLQPTQERDVVVRDGISVAVQAPPTLRAQIVDTIRVVGSDQHGCAVDYSVAADRLWHLPETSTGSLAGVDAADVTGVAACRYARHAGPDPDPLLTSSVRVEGDAAVDAVAGILDSPVGGGPDTPGQCLPRFDVAYGDSAILLRVAIDDEVREVMLRYDGCVGHGFDDGATTWTLTREAVAPFIAGPNQPESASGAMLADILLG